MRNPGDLFLRSIVAEDEDYSGKRLRYFGAAGCSFSRCNFSGMRANSVDFAAGTTVTLYRDCSFDNSRLGSANGGCARFERCSFENVRIDLICCSAAEFIDCRFSGRLHGYFEGVVSIDWNHLARRVNDFTGNDFSRAELIDTAFRRGVDLSLQRLPADKSKYIYCSEPAAHIQALREMFFSFQGDLEKRRLGFVAINVLESILQDGQKQLFLCKDSLVPVGADVMEMVFERLSQCS